MIRTLIRAGMVATMLVPSLAFAVYDDVTMTTDTIITIQGLDFNVSGSSAAVESITVGASTFDVVLLENSTITIASADRRAFNVDPLSGGFTKTQSCNATHSIVTLTGGTSGSRTLTISPLSSTCATSGSSSSGGSGSSRSGARTVPVVSVPAVVATTPAATNASVTFSFTRSVSTGSRGEDVRNLQKFLNSKGFKISDSGDGSSGKETTFFGALTKAALIKFQQANGIDPIGIMGPMTRAKIKALSQ